MAQRSETFGRLLKAGIGSIANCEGKTAPVVEDELGAQIGRAHTAIQRYKSGYLPPEVGIVQILAEACVRRGLMGRSWLEQFLHAARHPNAQELADKLCPTGPQRPRPPHVYENLPAPIYSQFVMREQAFAEVIDSLRRRSAVVLIASLGGMGKTRLAREIAARCLKGSDELPQFDAVVWISDKDRPGTANLSVVLDTVAQTLDFPGFTQLVRDEKRFKVEQLLRQWRVLLVVDNFETITDGALLQWLLRLPEPSKAVITTREFRREFRNSAITVDLRGMNHSEAHELIAERLKLLRLDKLVRSEQQLAPLLTATGGNPKAIELALGLVKHERQPLAKVVEDLYAARGDLFADLFDRAWALLDEAARRVLLVATFFIDSASSEALAHSADVTGLALDRTLEHLIDLALLDEQHVDLDAPARYTTHALVHAFASAKLAERPEFEREGRTRLIDWYATIVPDVGCHWRNNSRLELLDMEYNNLFTSMEWASAYAPNHQLLAIFHNISCYYSGRGIWDKLVAIHLLRSSTAKFLGEATIELKALRSLISLLCCMGQPGQASEYLLQAEDLSKQLGMTPEIQAKLTEERAACLRGLGQPSEARELLTELLSTTQESADSALIMDVKLEIGKCLHDEGRLEEAHALLKEVLRDAVKKPKLHWLVFTQLELAQIELKLGESKQATKRVAYLEKTGAVSRDTIARLHYLQALVAQTENDYIAAQVHFIEAIDTFERMGMRRELAESRAELAALEAQLANV